MNSEFGIRNSEFSDQPLVGGWEQFKIQNSKFKIRKNVVRGLE